MHESAVGCGWFWRKRRWAVNDWSTNKRGADKTATSYNCSSGGNASFVKQISTLRGFQCMTARVLHRSGFLFMFELQLNSEISPPGSVFCRVLDCCSSTQFIAVHFLFMIFPLFSNITHISAELSSRTLFSSRPIGLENVSLVLNWSPSHCLL